MTKYRSIKIYCLFFFGSFFLVSCAPQVTFFVTKQPQYPIENVTTVSIGNFSEIYRRSIELPPPYNKKNPKARSNLKPQINDFGANKAAGDLVRAMMVAELSKTNQYRLINTSGNETGFTGVIPDRAKTGVISAEIRYFETSMENSEPVFFNLIATRHGTTFQESLALAAAKEVIDRTAQSSKSGFTVPVPYVEIAAAMEVTFRFTRLSNGKEIIPDQVFRSYFTRKWGGNESTSHLPRQLQQVIVTQGADTELKSNVFGQQWQQVELAFLEPDKFLAMGGKLKSNLSVPDNSVKIQTTLSREIIDDYIKMISTYTEETTLKVARGDSIAVNYINGNAYELAINRLENLDRSEDDSFNLGLAYESIGEYRQASRYYQEALDKAPGNDRYQTSLKRVSIF